MSAVAPTPSASTASTGGATSVNGPRNGLKAPSNLLHGSQANFAALLSQADEVPDDAAHTSWLTDTTTATQNSTKDDNATGQPGDPQAFMNWIGLQQPGPATLPPQAQLASALSTGEPTSANLGTTGGNDLSLNDALRTETPTAAVQTTGNTGSVIQISLSPDAVQPLNKSILITKKLDEKNDFFQIDSGTPPSAATDLAATHSKIRLNGIRAGNATAATLPSSSTSTLRLAAQHQVGMAASSAGTTSLNTVQGKTGQAAPTAQDTDRLTANRLSGNTRLLSEPTLSDSGTPFGTAGSDASASGFDQDRPSSQSGQGDGSLAWTSTLTENNIHHPGDTGTNDAQATAFQGQMDEIVQQMGPWFAQGTQSASLTLDADGSMPMDIEVTLDKGKVSIRFGSEEEGAREALMSSIDATLKPLLAQHGLNLADVQVTQNPSPNGQNPASGQMAQQQSGDEPGRQSGGPHAPSFGRVGTSRLQGADTAPEVTPVTRTTRPSQGAVDLFA